MLLWEMGSNFEAFLLTLLGFVHLLPIAAFLRVALGLYVKKPQQIK